MSNYINLMTSRARVRECSRTRVRQWSRILVAVMGMLALHAAIVWWPIYTNSQRCAALEAQYYPLRQMKSANRKLEAQIAHTLDRSQLELALSKQTPVLTLVGVVSQAVAERRGKVFLEQISYKQDAQGPESGDSPAEVALKGFSDNPNAVKQLAESLRSALPFADVQLQPIQSIELNDYPMQTFQIKCCF